MRHLPLAIAVTAHVAILALLIRPVGASDAVEVLRPAAQHFEKDTAGYVERHAATNQHMSAGLLSTSAALSEIQLLNDYAQIEVRIVSEQSDDKRADAGTMANDTKRRNDDALKKGTFHWPIQEKYFAEYRYSAVVCLQCESGQIMIAFESDQKDKLHASGAITVDTKSNRITALRETQYIQNQPNVDSTLQDITFGDSGGMWVPVRATVAFKGHYGPFHGGGEATFTYGDYRRFATLEAAQNAMK